MSVAAFAALPSLPIQKERLVFTPIYAVVKCLKCNHWSILYVLLTQTKIGDRITRNALPPVPFAMNGACSHGCGSNDVMVHRVGKSDWLNHQDKRRKHDPDYRVTSSPIYGDAGPFISKSATFDGYSRAYTG